MEMQALPGWVDPLATVFVALAVLTAIAVAYDVYGRGYRQRVRSMEVVWVLSALWLGPFALGLYARTGRPRSEKWRAQHPTGVELGLSAAAASGGLPGGAASLVGHVIGVPVVLAAGWSLFGVDMYAMIAFIAVLAIAMLFAFEYSTGARRNVGAMTVGAALLAATVTVLAFDIGMGGWMLLLHFNELMPPLASVSFLFLMQIGIVLGFLTGYPAVALLLKRGTKVAV
jgi:hypothetical protein